MGFWNELKELGRGIGSDLAQLGGELKQIGKDAAEEIKQDPTKYFLDSAKEIAEGGVKLAAGGAKLAWRALENIPDINFKNEKKLEDLYQSGKMTGEQANDYEQHRKQALINANDYQLRLINQVLPESLTSEELLRRVELLEGSEKRLKWYLSLPSLEVGKEMIESINENLKKTNSLISEIKKLEREQRSKEEALASSEGK